MAGATASPQQGSTLLDPARVAAILASSTTYLGVLDAEGRWLHVHPRVRSSSADQGTPSLIGTLFWESPWWQDRPRARERARQAFGNARPVEEGGGVSDLLAVLDDVPLQLRLVRLADASGAAVLVEAIPHPESREAAQLGALLGTAGDPADVPDVEALATLLQRTIVTNLPNSVVLVFDRAFRFRMVEGRALYDLGLANEALLGRRLWEALPAPVADVLAPHYEAVLEGEEFALQVEHGGLVFETHGVPVRDGQGNVLAGLVLSQNVTARVRVEERLRMLEAAVANLTDLVIITDADPVEEHGPRIVYVNDAFVRRTGYAREEVLGRSPRFLAGPDTDPVTAARVQEALVQGVPLRAEIVNYTKSGEPYWLDFALVPLMGEDGRPTHFVCIQRDITERRKADEALRASERRYRLLFEENPSPMWVFDVETHEILAVNQAAIAHYGWSREEFLQMSIRDIRPPEEVPILLSYTSSSGAGPRRAERIFRHLRKDGSVIDVEVASHGITWDGRRARIVLVTDVTDRVRSQAEQARLAAIIESSEDAIISKSADGVIVTWNAGAQRLFGWAPDEIIGRSMFELVPTERHAEEWDILARVGNGEHVAQYETERLRRDGRRIPVSLTVSPVLDAEGRVVGIASIMRDVSTQRSLEEQLRQAQRMEAVGRLAGGIAHDFNNLLTAIDGHADFLLEDLPPGSPSRTDAEEIRSAAARATALTRQLLAFGRKQVLQLRVLDAAEIVSGVERLLRRVIGEDVELVTRLAKGKAYVRADRGQLEQVLLNLAVNSRDAMPDGGVLIIETRRLAPSVAAPRGTLLPHQAPHGILLLSVTDTGIGMDSRTRAQAFEPFFTTKPAGKGTGLGLATVYGIIAQLGGSVWIDSTPGKGTTVTVALPLEPPSGAMAELRREAEDAGVPTALPPAGSTLLVVEDETSVRTTVRRLLTGRGYEVLEAANGVEALEVWRNARARGVRLDALVTDVVMPGMGGRELVRQLRAEQRSLPVVFMSGYIEDGVLPELAADLDGHGRVRFIQKPFRAHDLLSAVVAVLDDADGEPAADAVTPTDA